MPAGESLAALARQCGAQGATMAVYLSAARPAQLRAELLAGYAPDVPALVVAKASWPDEVLLRTTVDGLADALTGAGVRTVALVLVGPALAEPEPTGAPRSRLYDPAYSHGCRRRSTGGSTVGRPVPAAKRRVP